MKTARPLHSKEDFLGVLRSDDAGALGQVDAALRSGDLDVWLQARWEPSADAKRVAEGVAAIRKRHKTAPVALARFALRNFFQPGQPFPLCDGLTLESVGALSKVMQGTSAIRNRSLIALQERIEDGTLMEWLYAASRKDAQRIGALLDEAHRRCPKTRFLRALVACWAADPKAPLPLGSKDVFNPRLLVETVRTEAGWREAFEALNDGRIRMWLCSTGRLAGEELARLDNVLEDENTSQERKLALVLAMLDPQYAPGSPTSPTSAINFGWLEPTSASERVVEIRTKGDELMLGDAWVEPGDSGVTVEPSTLEGKQVRLRLRVRPGGNRAGVRQRGALVVKTMGGELRIPWRFAVGQNPWPVRIAWMGALALGSYVVANVLGAFDPEPKIPFETEYKCEASRYPGCQWGFDGIYVLDSGQAKTAPRSDAGSAFSVRPHQRLRAVSWHFVTTELGTGTLQKEISIQGKTVRAGSSIFLLYSERGCYVVWPPGTASDRLQVTSSIERETTPYLCSEIGQIGREPKFQWWVKVQSESGAVGFLDRSRVNFNAFDERLVNAIADSKAAALSTLAKVDAMIKAGAELNSSTHLGRMEVLDAVLLRGNVDVLRGLLRRGWTPSEGSESRPQLGYLGTYTSLRSTGEHEYGTEVRLWTTGGKLLGLLSHSGGRLVGDTPAGLIDDVAFDPKTGRTSFTAKLTLGEHHCKTHPGIPSRDVLEFSGTLTEASLSGEILLREVSDQDSMASSQRVILRKVQGESEGKRVTNVAQFTAMADPILKFRGPKWDVAQSSEKVAIEAPLAAARDDRPKEGISSSTAAERTVEPSTPMIQPAPPATAPPGKTARFLGGDGCMYEPDGRPVIGYKNECNAKGKYSR